MAAKKGESDVKYKGFVIRWTGWKTAQDNIYLVGQWVALNKTTGKTNYASTRGGCRFKSDSDDHKACGTHEDQPITIFSSATEKETRKQMALASIIREIDDLEGARKDG